MASDGTCFLSDIALLIGLYRVKQQCSLERFMIALTFIVESQEYPEWMNQYAAVFVDILNEILFCGEILRIYFQEGYYNIHSSQEKTSNDATTRLSIIFSAGNDDIYILRVDLPHKGEKSFHINMEEVVGDKIIATGYPIDLRDAVDLREKLDGKYNELFFEMDGKAWFRSKFKSLLKKIELTDEQRTIANDIFHAQGHLTITIDASEGTECINQIQFVNEIKEYVKRFKMKESDFLAFGKDDIDYCSEILKIRSLFRLEQEILNRIIKNEKEELISCSEVYKLYLKMLRKKCDDESDFSLIELWEKIEEVLLYE